MLCPLSLHFSAAGYTSFEFQELQRVSDLELTDQLVLHLLPSFMVCYSFLFFFYENSPELHSVPFFFFSVRTSAHFLHDTHRTNAFPYLDQAEVLRYTDCRQ